MKPTDSELEILHILWQLGPSTVRTVNDLLNEARKGTDREPAGYTTTLKLMQIMLEKGLVSRTEDGRTHVYASVVGEADAQSALLDQFVNNTFRGSTARLVMQALGSHQASPDELEEIKALIAQLENNQKQDPE
ncbi:MAG: BlaI/MecI/CopY family transcriptional regulator [Saprospiraceae bacterium]|nr:BlaI/MecI/CopY family transcriptional regulator [Saprospiraceae bacterium]